jgi:hypothetical protein
MTSKMDFNGEGRKLKAGYADVGGGGGGEKWVVYEASAISFS